MPYSPPLQQLTQQGICADQSKFDVDGVIYAHLNILDDQNNHCRIPYEPVLVCPTVSTNIFGMKSMDKFEQITKNNKEDTITFTKNDNTLTVRVIKEKIEKNESAYIAIAKNNHRTAWTYQIPVTTLITSTWATQLEATYC